MSTREPTRLVVDADASPFKDDMLDLCQRAHVEVILVCSPRHDMPQAPHVRILHVDHRDPDAADFAVVNESRAGDVVVTQDAGLAAMLLPKGVRVLSTRGFWYTPDSVDRSLEVRHQIRKARRRGETPKVKGTRALTLQDQTRFRRALASALGLPVQMAEPIPPTDPDDPSGDPRP